VRYYRLERVEIGKAARGAQKASDHAPITGVFAL